ncbi:porin [Achromobacter aloeverae]
MKKTLLFMAVLAGEAGAAHASTSSVSLYGVVAPTVSYVKVSGKGSSIFMDDGTNYGGMASRWGLTGSEDLGSGLKAIFTLEGGFDASNGQLKQEGRLFGRQSFVGLSSSTWGDLTLGRQLNMYDYYMWEVDAMMFRLGGATAVTDFGPDGMPRADNMIKYSTPSMNGLRMAIGYSFDLDSSPQSGLSRDGGSTNRYRNVTAGAIYNNGPLTIAATTDQTIRPHGMDGSRTIPTYALGAAYDFGSFKLTSSVTRAPHGFAPQGWSMDFHEKGVAYTGFATGASVPLGARTSLMAEYQFAHSDEHGVRNLQVLSVGALHELSKRTSVYVAAMYGKNYDFTNAYSPSQFANNVTSKVLSFNLMHSF